MCGIAGIVWLDGRPVEKPDLVNMQSVMTHRGPDDDGVWTHGHVGLAHNRLAILDLSQAAHQPMVDERTGACLSYNGEIYNFRQLREELQGHGHHFRSTSDTEVVLLAYRQWGTDFLKRLNGMFALAIWDQHCQHLFLARDRLGIKPLYYYNHGGLFAFASETKALLQLDEVKREFDRAALPEYLAFRYLVDGRTLLKNVAELRPAHQMTVSTESIITRRYWDFPTACASERDAAAWLDEFQQRLTTSVRRQMVADVPVGCALSGGIDSTLIAGCARDVSQNSPRTFTIGFADERFDERPFARLAAQRLGLENCSEVLDESSFHQRAAELTWHMDEPINHPNSIGIWQLAKIARQHVKVLLSGEGGDELLAGYSRFRRTRQIDALRRWLPGAGSVGRLAARRLGGRLGRAGWLLSRDEEGAMIWSSAYMPGKHLQRLLNEKAASAAEQPRRQLLAEIDVDGSSLRRQSCYEMATYLVSLLIRVDKMCMANSLENRVPLLDHELVEFAVGMPDAMKSDRRHGKIVLRRLLPRWFDEAQLQQLFDRPKLGFAVPWSYFQGPGLAYLRELLTSRSFRQREWVQPQAVEQMLADHESGRANLNQAIWPLAALEHWARTFLDGRAAGNSAA